MNLDNAAAYIKRQVENGTLDYHDLARLVERAQLAMGLTADGMPGPITIARLDGFFIESDLTPPPVEILPPVMDAAARRDRAVQRFRDAQTWQQEQRAKGVKVGYGLGFGGKDPKAPHPFEYDEQTGTWRCDCSGAVDWSWELERQPEKGIWLNTDRLEADARGQVKHDLGYEVAWEDALAGDIVVYGAGPLVGHTGLFTKDGAVEAMHCHGGVHGGIDVDLDPRWWRVTKHAVVLRMR